MDVIVKWCTRDHDGVDNYVDDLYVPNPQTKAVADTLERYVLRTKPVEPASSARVLDFSCSAIPCARCRHARSQTKHTERIDN